MRSDPNWRGEKTQIERVVSTSLLRACREFLKHDLVFNALPLGDLYSPLLQASDIYSAIENSRIVGVCTVFRAFSMPSIVFGTAMSEIKRALFEEALNGISKEFISLCPCSDVDMFREYSTILHHHIEQQMVTNRLGQVEYSNIRATRVRKSGMESLSKFYVEHEAEAWTRMQFEAGPYYCVKKAGEIVSAAGVHFVTPEIAQLGNIVTDEAYRNRGFATACTSALITDLTSRGRIISLFVRTDNINAIRVYERLGFFKIREIAFLKMRRNGATTVSV